VDHLKETGQSAIFFGRLLRMPSKRPKCTHVVAAAVLGLEGSGKTTLVKQLRGHSETGAFLAHHELDVTPTAGMELDTWQHGSTKIKVKDVGGAFAGSWPKYLKGVDTLVYLVDLSNPMQLGTATIELFHLLVDPGMARAPGFRVFIIAPLGDAGHNRPSPQCWSFCRRGTCRPPSRLRPSDSSPRSTACEPATRT